MKPGFRLLILCIIFIFVHGQTSFAGEPHLIDSLSILEEDDLNQCVSHIPLFSWESKDSLDSNCRFQITIMDKKSGEIVCRQDSISPDIRRFEFISLNTLKDGHDYLFTIGLSCGDSLLEKDTLYFRMNSPPSRITLYPIYPVVITGDSLRVVHTVPFDRETERLTLKFQIARDSLFRRIEKQIEIPFRKEKVSGDSVISILTLPSLEDNKSYFVRAVVSDGVEEGEWSNGVKFWLNRISEPPESFALVSPGDGEETPWEPELKWEIAPDPDQNLGGGIAEYIVLLGLRRDLSHPELSLQTRNERLKVSELKKHVRYYWTVLAKDSTDLVTASSDTFTFVTNEGNTPPELPLVIVSEDSILSPGDSICWWSARDEEEGDTLSYILQFFSFDSMMIFQDSIKGEIPVYFSRRYCYKLPFMDKFQEGKRYYFRVRSYDNWGGISHDTLDFSTFFWDDGINYPPEPPVILSENNFVYRTLRPWLVWEPSYDPDFFDTPGQMCYVIKLLPMEMGESSGEEYFYVGRGKSRFQFPLPLRENAFYCYQMRAIDPAGDSSSWSEKRCFWIDARNEPPTANASLKYPLFLEEISLSDSIVVLPVSDPDPFDTVSYLFEVYRDRRLTRIITDKVLRLPAGGENGEASLVKCPVKELENSRLEDNHLYYLQVKVKDRQGLSPDTKPPVVRIVFNRFNNLPEKVKQYIYPPAGSIVHQFPFTISWTAANDPDFSDTRSTLNYLIHLWDKEKISSSVDTVLESRKGVTSFEVNIPLPDNRRYFLSLQTRDDEEATSGWSDTIFFNLDYQSEPPYQVTRGFTPADSSIVETEEPVITWLPVDDPDPFQSAEDLRYLVQYYSFCDSTKKMKVYSDIGVNSVQLYNLQENCFYRYRVRAIDPTGISGQWSPWQLFVVDYKSEPPADFALYYPTFGNDTVRVNFNFQWQATNDPDPFDQVQYILYVGTDSVLERNPYYIVLVEEQGDTISYSPDFYIQPFTRYYWGVMAYDLNGNITWGSNSGEVPFPFVKLDPFGKVSGDYPSAFSLKQNYPNPFNNRTSIEFALPIRTHVRLAIYDLLGKVVYVLADGYYPPGIHRVEWDGRDMNGFPVPGGMYLCRLETPEFSQNKKLLLLR